ncbi:exonuclease VIII [Xanthomonas phage FoX2]|uniref:Exoribonuclease VIII n=2 Tax=Foxunavirus TaxID=2948712 RepID=A0A858NMW2_9CAUD|nr:exonuclease VIII [Xanthomonas phage FoX1]YP_010106746.1 exonuclease VIII [Xanthomonas phage FoX2]QJB21776.1 exodeoxyribonuclease VIII [Xanthomonas phage FoX1]QJB21859.1 exoribonuclease VIII [Xanthomonas phage FoX2]
MDPGIYRGIPNDQYHHGVGISKSGLDLVRKSPAHYRAVVTAANDNERKSTPAQAIGTALHMIVLEPELFAKTYTLALQRSDVPEAIDDREQLVAMVQELNAGRLPKLPTTGAKAEIVSRIVAAYGEHAGQGAEFHAHTPDELAAMKGAELSAILKGLNDLRPGLLPISGSRHDLAEILRANGKPVTLWSDVQAEWLANNGHRQVLTAEQFEQLRNMRDAIQAHPAASKLLAGAGEAELSAYWMQTIMDPLTGEVIGEELCRVRPDYLRHDGIVVDLKTTEDAGEEEFQRSIAKWAYHVQDDYYLRGISQAREHGAFEYNDLTGEITPINSELQEPRAFVFIAVEKSARVVDGQAMGVGVYRLDDESRALGRQQWKADLARYAECKNTGEWPGYSPKIRQIKLPAWQFTRAAAQVPSD